MHSLGFFHQHNILQFEISETMKNLNDNKPKKNVFLISEFYF